MFFSCLRFTPGRGSQRTEDKKETPNGKRCPKVVYLEFLFGPSSFLLSHLSSLLSGEEGERVTEGDPRLGKVTREPKVYTSRMSFLLTVGFLKVGNQPITGNRKR